MQVQQDEGSVGAPADSTAETTGLDQSPDRVELRGGGWKGAIGYGHNFKLVSPCTTGGVLFELICIKEFFFLQAATILIVQGMVLSDFFPPDVYFARRGLDEALSRGPYVFLQGKLTEPHQPPLRLRDLVLARVHDVPSGMSKEQVLGGLLRAFPYLLDNPRVL